MNEQQGDISIALISVHGLIRGQNLELGRDADTGGQTLYVLELAQALAEKPEVSRVELFTRLVKDESVDADYAQPIEKVSDKLTIVRIEAGPEEYIFKEQLWDHLDTFSDNMVDYFRQRNRYPDILHSHYADAGYVGSQLANQLSIPLIHTGHSLGRVKRARLIANGVSPQEIDTRYNMIRRVDAEEYVLATAERVITSTHQEIEEQYEIYDFYHPEQMRVLPPGTNLSQFKPPLGGELSSLLFRRLTYSLASPQKPIILALSRPDTRKNITALIVAYGQSPELQEKANLVIVAGNRDDVDDLESGAQQVFHEIWLAIDRYDLYGKVALPKHHSRDEVPFIYRIAAASGGVFVNPALTEPFGLTIIEAIASGLPVVATEDGGPRDIAANCQNGILIDPLEPKTITDALLTLFRDEAQKQQMIERGLKGVQEHYAWQAHAERYLKLICPIIKESERLPRRPIARRSALYKDRALVTSLDQNLMGCPDALSKLLALLKQHRKSTLFIVATGRRLDSALRLLKHYNIPEPDVLMTSGGAEIHYAPKLTTDTHWQKHIDYHWVHHKVRNLLDDYPGLTLQPKSEQTYFKISYLLDTRLTDVEEIKAQLLQEDLTANVQFSFGQYLDVLPIRASKGMALRYIADRWQIPLERILVAGGSGSDEDMMRGNTLAAVVANRHDEELFQLTDIERIYFAERSYEEGILEAIDYYDFFGACCSPETNNSDPLAGKKEAI
ncbi:HAD-IIB family hydrolase [Thiomicrorhabdus sp. zzn3]|uniref:HAD-IIB family hydrolase n=1 Tax=Thiomicrorhabdus sp. zzn3 TaxID=3039775 RepID=UPI002437246B|nr:HAD-IIB family hydrolase [Thiomicrorhabdus sp. zzn3]MDG6778269.1 HAD-IIB family hydrolase [Thiomicrorhabdus sp. zzn3]